jgi:hypothetical protein
MIIVGTAASANGLVTASLVLYEEVLNEHIAVIIPSTVRLT